MLSCGACAPSPTGPQPIEGRNAERRREVAVRPAAAGGFLEIHAELSRQFPGGLEQAPRASGALHGRPVQPAVNLHRTALVEWLQRREPSFKVALIGCFRRTHVDFYLAFSGHDVAARSSLDDARAYGDAAVQSSKTGDPLDLTGHLNHRVRALFEIEAGVRRAAPHDNPVVAHALASCFQFSLESGAWLEHQNGDALARGIFSESAGRRAPDFFVRIHLENNLATHRHIKLAQNSHREDKEHQARFHIEHARSPQTPARLPERHGPERADRPDGIGVPQGKDLPLLLRARKLKFAAQVVTVAPARKRAHPRDIAHGIGEQRAKPVHGSRLIAGRFAFHQGPNAHDHLLLFGTRRA